MTVSKVTSQNCQSIAKNLRYIASCLPPVQSLEEFRSALEDELFTGPGHASYTEIFARLADLIDPTCEVVGSPDNDEFMVRVVSGFMCKKCGHESIVERNCDGWAEPPNYCPHCGARVVNGVPDAEA